MGPSLQLTIWGIPWRPASHVAVMDHRSGWQQVSTDARMKKRELVLCLWQSCSVVALVGKQQHTRVTPPGALPSRPWQPLPSVNGGLIEVDGFHSALPFRALEDLGDRLDDYNPQMVKDKLYSKYCTKTKMPCQVHVCKIILVWLKFKLNI